MTRTRCVATMLEGGHAENALPQTARATVNCRIMPGVAPKTVEAELKTVAGAGVEVTPFANQGRIDRASPLRPDVVKAYTDAVRAHPRHRDPDHPANVDRCDRWPLFPRGGDPGLRGRGHRAFRPTTSAPTASTSACRSSAFYDNVLHWEYLVRTLAGENSERKGPPGFRKRPQAAGCTRPLAQDGAQDCEIAWSRIDL